MAGSAIRISNLANPADTFPSALDSFLVYCEAKNLSENTINGYYRCRLEKFGRFLDRHAESSSPREVTKQLVREFVTDEMRRHSPSTANHSLTALKAFYRFLCEDGFIDVNPTDGVPKLRQREKVIETFSKDQIESVLGVCDRSFVGLRDHAVITLLYDCGLRASELCGLAIDDVDWKEQTLRVLGKGDKERIVSYGQATRMALSKYIARHPELATQALFVTNLGDPITRFRLAEIVRVRSEQAGVTGVRCSPHTFRHTFAVTHLRNGGDVFSLQKILGHSHLSMARRYCELSQTDALERHRMYSPADRLKPVGAAGGRRQRIA